MSATGRRELLRFGAGALLLPIVSMVPFHAAAHPDDGIVPPLGPMRYTRRIERTLADGARFVASRSYSVVFRPEPTGFRVEGTPLDVEITAPEALAAFVRLERERQEVGLFPIRLDEHGRIFGQAPDGESQQLEAAVREIVAELERLPLEPAEREELRRFVGTLHQETGRMVTLLPLDLFAPGEPSRRESRQIALPGGGAGEVAVTFTAERDPATGLMRAARREVRTSLSGDVRRTVETWQLEPLR